MFFIDSVLKTNPWTLRLMTETEQKKSVEAFMKKELLFS